MPAWVKAKANACNLQHLQALVCTSYWYYSKKNTCAISLHISILHVHFVGLHTDLHTDLQAASVSTRQALTHRIDNS
jgi:hypothetical protein